jgi:hypothetical protein
LPPGLSGVLDQTEFNYTYTASSSIDSFPDTINVNGILFGVSFKKILYKQGSSTSSSLNSNVLLKNSFISNASTTSTENTVRLLDFKASFSLKYFFKIDLRI